MKLRKTFAAILCITLLTGCSLDSQETGDDALAGAPESYKDTEAIVTPLIEAGGDVFEIDVDRLQVGDDQSYWLLNARTNEVVYAVWISETAGISRFEIRAYDPATDTVKKITEFQSDFPNHVVGYAFENAVFYTLQKDSFQSIMCYNRQTGETKTIADTATYASDEAQDSATQIASIFPDGSLFFNILYGNEDGDTAYAALLVTQTGEVMLLETPPSGGNRSGGKDFKLDAGASGYAEPVNPGGDTVSNSGEQVSLTIDVFNRDGTEYDTFNYAADCYWMRAHTFLLDDALVSGVYYRETGDSAEDWMRHQQTGKYGTGRLMVEHFSGKHYDLSLDDIFVDNSWFPFPLPSFIIDGGTNGNTAIFLSNPISKAVIVQINKEGAVFYSVDLRVSVDDSVGLVGMRMSDEIQGEPLAFCNGFLFKNLTTQKLVVVLPPVTAMP